MKSVVDYLESAEKSGKLSVLRDSPLSSFSSFRIGGNADYIVKPKTVDSLKKTISVFQESGIKIFVAGNATNILFSDEGYRGCVLFTQDIKDINVDGEEITAGCGVSVTHLAAVARDNGLTGIEFLYGIPGTVGGAVFMNAGAYEHSVSEAIIESTAFSSVTGDEKTFKGAEHNFGYRQSIYMDSDYLITGAKFRLKKSEPEEIRAVMDDYMQRRISKQPLEYPSAGSVFKRAPGHFTGKLIDEAGLKGTTVGGAQVSEKHAGFIINRGGATAKDVLELIDLIKMTIKERNGVDLECEVRYVQP